MLARTDGEPHRQLRGLAGGVRALPVTGGFIAAKAAAEEGLRLAQEIGHAPWLARFTAWSGMVAHQERDFDAAARLATEGLGMALRCSDRRALILVGLLVSGMPEEHAPKLALLPPLEELYDMAVELGDRQFQSWLLGHLTSKAVQRGDAQSAASCILRRVALVRGSKSWSAIGFSLFGAVTALSQLGHPKLAARRAWFPVDDDAGHSRRCRCAGRVVARSDPLQPRGGAGQRCIRRADAGGVK